MAEIDRIPSNVRRILSEHKENPPTGYRRYYYLVEIINDIDNLMQFGNVTAKNLAEVAGEDYGVFRKQLVNARRMKAKMDAAGINKIEKKSSDFFEKQRVDNQNGENTIDGDDEIDLTTPEGRRAAQAAKFKKL